MGSFFYKLGKMVGPNLRKANWMLRSVAGTEAEAIQAEHAVGRDLSQGFVQQADLDPDIAAQEWLADLGSSLTRCVKERERRFTFRAIRSNEINAVALPGGFIFVMRPLLEVCNWDRDQIAFVLGHEMGHVLKRHAIERLMANSVIRTGIGRLPVGGVLKAPLLNLATALLNQGYAQDQELEADKLGVQLARSAGFEPTAAVRLLNLLRSIPSEAWVLSTYLSSHPPVDVRIRNVERWQ